MWSSFVDLIRVAIFSAAHVCGGSIGGGILLVSFGVRLALMPWTLRLARRAIEQQRRMAALAPEIERIRKRWTDNPQRLFAESQALYRENDVKLLDTRSFLGALVQTPLFAGLFSAIRGGLANRVPFFGIADLAQPSALLVAVVALLTAGAAFLTPPPQGASVGPWAMVCVAGIATFFFLSATSSALALSVGAGAATSAIQNVLLRRSLAASSPKS